VASVVLRILEAQPALLDCYYDLELHAVLLGRDPDLRYSERLQLASQEAEALLQALLASLRVEAAAPDLEQLLSTMNSELRVAREEGEKTLSYLHQVQEDCENYFMADSEKQRQLVARDQELEELRLTKAAQDIAHEQEVKALRERLEPQLAELVQRLSSRDTELHEVREAAELTLLQLHQVQEQLEHYFLVSGEEQHQWEAREREFESLREFLESRLAELEQRLASKDTELLEAREALELSQLQLHQVQEELEHYFLKARASDQLAQAQCEQLKRAQRLMVRLQPHELLSTPLDQSSLGVQVWPEVTATMPKPTLETEALLSAYAASLQRSSVLLDRARRL